MTGGGFLVAYDDLYERASAALVELGGRQAADSDGAVVQVADAEGRLFTLWEKTPAGFEYEAYEGPFNTAPGVQIPDISIMTACPFDCRWPDLTSRMAEIIARTAEAPTWLLDSDDVFWDARAVDPLVLRL